MADSTEARLVIGPNASLSVGAAWLFMAGITATVLLIAGFFVWRGYWPVLPFAGLELGALAAGLWVSMHGNRYREVLSFEGDVLRIEFGMAGRGVQSSLLMLRSWTQARLEPGPHRNDPVRLVLASHGHSVEIGRCLTDEERERLCVRIKQLLRPAWRAGIAGAGPAAG